LLDLGLVVFCALAKRHRGEIAMKSALVLVVLLASGYSSMMTSPSTSGMGWVVTVIAGPVSFPLQ